METAYRCGNFLKKALHHGLLPCNRRGKREEIGRKRILPLYKGRDERCNCLGILLREGGDCGQLGACLFVISLLRIERSKEVPCIRKRRTCSNSRRECRDSAIRIISRR